MFGQIPPTAYDLRFELLGIPVRVHPVFWATSAFLAWYPGRMDIVLVQVLCIFVAILVHEMGHALMTRRFGWQPEIVLYILGGYATSVRHSTWRDIAVSAAGPGAGFLLLLAIWLPCRISGVLEPGSTFMQPHFDPQVMQNWPAAIADGTRGNQLFQSAIDFSLFINFMWNAINLLPVLPLDGGQISREYWNWARPNTGMQICLKLSLIASGAVAVWSALSLTTKDKAAWWTVGNQLGLDAMFLGLMFGYLCYRSYQELQNIRGRSW